MLHISISASLYRPLSVHALISKQHRNVVQLHETTHENLEENQNMGIPSSATLNKENIEHQNHLKKLQNQCPHHNHHENYDPDDIVAKLQTKLRSIDATDAEIDLHDKEDSVSINSSVSQDKYHHQQQHQNFQHHHGQHHHHQHHHIHSGHETPKHHLNQSGHHTPQHFHSGQHTPHHHHHTGFLQILILISLVRRLSCEKSDCLYQRGGQ